MTRRSDVLGTCLAAGIVLSACGALSEVSAPSAPAAPSGSVTIAGCRPFKALVPTNTVETCGATILEAVTARLMTYDNRTGQARPDLAQSVVTKDAKRFTVTLRAGAQYADGTPVRAADFVKAWNYGAHGRNKQLNQSSFELIAGFAKTAGARSKVTALSGLKVKSERVFTVTLSKPNATFVQRLGMLAYAPLPPSFFADKGAAFKRAPLGAGPYRVVSGSATSGFVLGANPGYTGPTPPSVESVTVKLYDNYLQAYDDLLTHRVDLLDFFPGVPPQAYNVELAGRLMKTPTPILQTMWFPSPKADKSYANAKLRRALALAIDRDAIIRSVYGGDRVRATGWAPRGAYGVGSKGCGSACGFNPKQAKLLFKAAGGHSGPIRIAFNADGDHRAWVTAVCKSITKTLGAVCKPTAVRDFGTFRSRIEANKQPGLIRAGWQADYPSIENFLTGLYKTGAAANDGDYSSPKFDALLAKAAATVDITKANALYRQAEAVLRADMPAIPLWANMAVGGFSENIRSAELTIFGTYDLTSIELA